MSDEKKVLKMEIGKMEQYGFSVLLKGKSFKGQYFGTSDFGYYCKGLMDAWGVENATLTIEATNKDTGGE